MQSKQQSRPPDGGHPLPPGRRGSRLANWLCAVAVGALACLSGGVNGADTVAYPLRWRWSNPTPHGNNIKDMAINPYTGLVVQVGERGRVYTSLDLDLWTPLETGTSNALRGVTLVNNRIVVVGEAGTVLYTDASGTFIAANIAPTTDWLEGVDSMGSTLMAVGDNGSIYVSTDAGTNWTKRSVAFSAWLRSVAIGSSRAVVVGENGFIADSIDAGQTWNVRVSGTTQHLNKVFFNRTFFMALGAGGIMLTNRGNIWAPVTGSGATNELFSGTAPNDAGARLAVGDNELRLWDSAGWSNQLYPAKTNGAPAWIYYSALKLSETNNAFLVGGRTGLMAEGYKTNGAFYWYQPSYPVRNWLWDVARVGGLYVAVGDHGAIMTSLEGVSWQLEVPPDAVTNKVLFGLGGDTNLLVAVGEGGHIIVSTNAVVATLTTNQINGVPVVTTNYSSSLGIEWTAVTPNPTTNDLQGVAKWNGQYLVAGGRGVVLASTNGQNWVTRSTPTTNVLTSLAGYTGGVIAAGSKGTLLRSTDGVSWSLVNSGTTNWIYRVRYLNGTLVAVGQNGLILTSTDGANWTPRVSGTTAWLNDVHFIGDTYFALGTSGTLQSSTNLVSWRAIGTITGKSLYGAATDGRQLIAVGIEGVILRSQILPATNAVEIIGLQTFKNGPLMQLLFLFGGQPDQQFNLESNDDLSPTNWWTDARLEVQDASGTVYYLQTLTNAPARRFFRTRLIY